MARPLIVSLHAVQRYQERVANVPDDEAEAALSGPAFMAACKFGGAAVILPSGHRAIVADGTVVTVLPRGFRPNRVFRGRNEN